VDADELLATAWRVLLFRRAVARAERAGAGDLHAVAALLDAEFGDLVRGLNGLRNLRCVSLQHHAARSEGES
jgi:hypothetical protein